MKLVGFALLALVASAAYAQQPSDPLAVALPTGKVVHFPTAEQKAKYLAALAARQPALPASAPAVLAPVPAGTKPAGLGHTALDEKPSGSGKVNINAPPFTAEYYMMAPDTWTGKKVILSIASLTPSGETTKDGLQQLRALTENTKMSAVLGQEYGGYITILAKPEVAQKLLLLCGTSTQYLGSGIDRTTMIKGEFRAVEHVDPYTSSGSKTYAVFVEQ